MLFIEKKSNKLSESSLRVKRRICFGGGDGGDMMRDDGVYVKVFILMNSLRKKENEYKEY